MINVVGARTGCKIVDCAIQVYGAEGLSQDTLLAWCYAAVRSLRIADRPDEVHLETVCKEEIKTKLWYLQLLYIAKYKFLMKNE